MRRRRAEEDYDSQDTETESVSTLSLGTTASEEENGFLPQAPILDGGSPIQKLPQDLILK